MPIEFDKKPGGANKRQRRRNGELPQPQKPPAEATPPETIRVRMLQAVRSKRGNFAPGQVIDLPAVIARSWIGFGLAEEDKMLTGAPETK